MWLRNRTNSCGSIIRASIVEVSFLQKYLSQVLKTMKPQSRKWVSYILEVNTKTRTLHPRFHSRIVITRGLIKWRGKTGISSITTRLKTYGVVAWISPQGWFWLPHLTLERIITLSLTVIRISVLSKVVNSAQRTSSVRTMESEICIQEVCLIIMTPRKSESKCL